MTNSKKMNNYSLIRISTVLILTVALVISTFSISIGARPRAESKSPNPPVAPYDPIPTNNATNISILADLMWNCSDPDGDPLHYDVYFGNTSAPGLVATNLTNRTYDPGTMNYSTQYFWRIVAYDNSSNSNESSLWTFTTEKEPQQNNPPYAPSNPDPADGQTGVLIDAALSWTGGDPDGDLVVYDIYFGTNSDPPKVISNQSGEIYNPGIMSYSTIYYWKIVAWDAKNATTPGPIWQFTTEKNPETPLAVTITKPRQGTFYFNDAEKLSLPNNNTIVYGKITITANVTSSTDVEKVEFYADGKLIGEDNSTPYEILWRPVIQFNGFSLKRTITVIAYDSDGKNATANITIIKWRFHPLPFIIAGIALATRLVLHTTVVGTFFNVQESRFSVSFTAIRAHYKTVGPFQTRRGVINFKHCTGGMIIGPTTLTKTGIFHRLAIGSFTFIGNINIEKIRFGQGLLLSRFLQPRTTNERTLLGGLQDLRS